MENGIIIVILIGGCSLFLLTLSLSLLALFEIVEIRHKISGLFSWSRKSPPRCKKKKRSAARKTTQDEKEGDLTGAAASIHEESWEAIFTVTPPEISVLPEPSRPHDPTLQRPCQRCHRLDAKRQCQYNYCAGCCKGKTDSVCKAHGTGYSYAMQVVNEAIKYGCHLEVDISYCNLKKCPPNVSHIGTDTASLNMSNNRLSSVPQDIGSLSGLEELFLQYNHLTLLPNSICNLSHLCELDVKNNNLTSLPNDIGSLSSLIILCATNNHITVLPSSIGKLSKLQELTLHSNELCTLPSEICQLKELKFLYCGDNKLQSLPDQFGKLVKLEELDVSGCEIVTLPESFSDCGSLIRVWLSNNRLIKLPTQIGNLTNLKELHVRNNSIRMFPFSIRSLTLYTFTAQHNPIIRENQSVKLCHTPTQAFPSLLELSARAIIHTRITTWKEEGAIPLHLVDMLNHYGTCSCCGRPFLKFFSYRVAFHLVGVFYRLPLYEYCCSPHYPSSCRRVN